MHCYLSHSLKQFYVGIKKVSPADINAEQYSLSTLCIFDSDICGKDIFN